MTSHAHPLLSWKKQKLLSRLLSLSAKPIAHCHHDANFDIFRIEQAKSEQLPIVDVDGSYLYWKQQTITQSGIAVASLPPPSPPLSGWEVVTDGNVQTMASKIPVVTSGTGIVHATSMAMYTCMYITSSGIQGHYISTWPVVLVARKRKVHSEPCHEDTPTREGWISCK